MYNSISLLLMTVFLLFTGINQILAFTPIKKYEDAPGILISPDFSLKINGTVFISVEKTRYLSYSKFALAGKGGSISIQITVLANTLNNVSIWPRKSGIVPSVDKKLKTITFTVSSSMLSAPQKFIVKADSLYMAIFVDLAEANAPKLTDANVKNIMDFGIDITGATLQTGKIQNAIDWMAANHEGKTILYFPNGVYTCSSLTINSSLQIYLQEGSRIQGSEIHSEYKGPFIWVKGNGSTSFKLFGRGIIDGAGTKLFLLSKKMDISMLQVYNCASVVIRDIILRESCSWTCNVANSSNVEIDNVKVVNPSVYSGSFTNSHFWNDSFDATSCQNYTNNNSFAWSNDDCIAIMSRDFDNDKILVSNLLGFTISSGIRLGWNSSKSFNNINVTNSEFVQTAYAAISLHELKNNAVYDKVTFSNCWFNTETTVGWRDDSIKRYVFFRVFSPDWGPGFAKINKLTFRNCFIEKQGYIFFTGDPVHTIKNVVFDNLIMGNKIILSKKDFENFNELHVGNVSFLKPKNATQKLLNK